MLRLRAATIGTVMLVGFGVGSDPASANVFKTVAVGLAQAGFNFQGARNFLSGGADMTVSRTFNNQTLDFGTTELTLSGTPRFQLSTGGRGLEVLDISLNTNNAPLNYTLVNDTGNQLTTIAGSFFLDATAKINSFGYYDLNIDVSSRQTITQDGRFVGDVTESDFDIGPINLRGNLFADLLASATDPIFDALGIDNIFAQFSGAGQFEAKMTAEAARAQAKAAAGIPLTSEEIAHLASIASMGAAFGLSMPDLSFLDSAIIAADQTAVSAPTVNLVPEPTTLLLLGAGGLALLRRRRR